MFQKLLKPHIKTALAIIWFAFTFSLVTWWWVFFLSRFNPAQSLSPDKLHTSYRMFAWEGSILMAAILLGGFALVLVTYRDQKRHQRLRFFFSTFSHDIKTSITRLRLQAEVLEEELPVNSNPVLRRLVHDIHRLDLQLENSLLLANSSEGSLLKEKVLLSDLLSSLRNEFPELSLELDRDAQLIADRRALLSVLKNLLQNSILHGKANLVRIKIRTLSESRLEILLSDDGTGFQGRSPIEQLGSEILKSQDSRSNGIGLRITKLLIEKMQGRIHFKSQTKEGFQAFIEIEGQAK